MRSLIQYTMLLMGTAFACAFQVAEGYVPPNPSTTRETNFTKINNSTSKASLLYQSSDILVQGVAVSLQNGTQLRLTGSYRTHQELEHEIKLAFQVYSDSDDILLLDGARTSFVETPDGQTAYFDYTYLIRQLNVPVKAETFFIKFNYVKEGEYWADQRDPSIELPAFAFRGVNKQESFTPLYSYFPTLVPCGYATYSIHLFRSYKHGGGSFNHQVSVESRLTGQDSKIDNKRYEIQGRPGESIHFQLANFKIEETGNIQNRLGFVWEHVDWYPQSDDTYRTSHVVSYPVCLLVWAFLMSCLYGVFCFSSRRETRLARVAGYTLLVILFPLALLVLPSTFFFIHAAILALFPLGRLLIKSRYGLYWTLVLFIAVNEIFWTYLFQTNPSHLEASLFSILLASLALSPFAYFRSRKATRLLGNVMLVLIASYYLTMSLYFLFFKDYPTFNILAYTSQATELLDSIYALMDDRFAVYACILLCFVAFINVPDRVRVGRVRIGPVEGLGHQ